MVQLVWAQPALDDLREIYDFIYREETSPARVVIMGVIHASRDLPPILEDRGMT